jgi:Uma2 family endonuclease
MSTAIAEALTKSIVTRQPRRISKEQFLRDYTNRDDGFKYEYNNGLIEKTQGMNQQQSKFFILLLDLFIKTQAFKSGARLVMETDMNTSKSQTRRPDIAFYTEEQLPLMWKGINQIAPWVIEIISPTDNAYKIHEKLEEYFQSGVQVVWHIYPASPKVEVYTAADDVRVCMGKTMCSANPVVTDFEISAEELFA